MTSLTMCVGSYALPSSGAVSPAARVGLAFERAWHERSICARIGLRGAIALLARQLRVERQTPERSVISFKQAIFRFGGVHEFPGLALDHHEDGDECAIAYEEAFTMFLDAYFGEGAELEG